MNEIGHESRRAHTVRCEICRVEGEASVHTLVSEGSTLAAWAQPSARLVGHAWADDVQVPGVPFCKGG